MAKSPLSRILAAVAFAGLASALVVSCGEPVGSGIPTELPAVGVSCSIPACRVNKTAHVYGYWTTSSCVQPYFGVRATGSGTATCTIGSGCHGTFSSWAAWPAGTATTQAPSGTYTLCAVVDLNDDWVNYSIGADSADAVGALNDVVLNGSTPAQTIADFDLKP